MLLPHHAQRIADSAIAPEVAEARGYWSATKPEELADLGFPAAQQLAPALVIPVYSIQGEVAFHQIRPDAPRVNDKGKELKYETPSGSVMRLDVPMHVAIRGALMDTSVPLWFTEGVRKADSAVSHGLACIGLIGVWNWRGKNPLGGTAALADFESIALKGREVIVCFDSDVMEKKEVRKALIRFRAFLATRGAKARIALLPAKDGKKVGLDDYFAQGGTTETLRKLIRDDLPKTTLPEDPKKRPSIRVDYEIERVAAEAEAALGAAPDSMVFWRTGELIRVVPGTPPRIESLPQPSLRIELAKAARWVAGKESGDTPIAPPREVAEVLALQGSWPLLRELKGITTTPILRPDGSVVETPGYDARTQVFYAPSAEFPPVPERIGFTDALAALEKLKEPFADFPWLEKSDMSAALALTLTLVGRQAIHGCVPFFAVRAPAQGSGKGLVIHVAASIAYGTTRTRRPYMTTQPPTAEEETKKLFAFATSGQPFVVYDNIERAFGSDVLASVLTTAEWSERVLGHSRMTTAAVPVLAATGLNLAVKGDLGRRTLPIDLDPKMEKPEERTGFKHPELEAWVESVRPGLVTAALTVLAWYLREGSPAADVVPFGSFEAWSGLIRSALVWLGEEDPCKGRARVQEDSDSDLDAQRTLLQAWEAAVGSEPISIADLVEKARGERALKDALAGLDGKLDPEKLDKRRLGYALRRLKNRILNGLRLLPLGKGMHGIRWAVVREHDDAATMTMPFSSSVMPSTQSTQPLTTQYDDMTIDSDAIRARAREKAPEGPGQGMANGKNGPDGGAGGHLSSDRHIVLQLPLQAMASEYDDGHDDGKTHRHAPESRGFVDNPDEEAA